MKDRTTVPGAVPPGTPSTLPLRRPAIPSLTIPATNPSKKSTATMLQLPRQTLAREDRPTAGLPCTRSGTSAWILGTESMLRRAGGSTETSITSCGLGMRLIAATSFLDTATLAVRGFMHVH